MSNGAGAAGGWRPFIHVSRAVGTLVVAATSFSSSHLRGLETAAQLITTSGWIDTGKQEYRMHHVAVHTLQADLFKKLKRIEKRVWTYKLDRAGSTEITLTVIIPLPVLGSRMPMPSFKIIQNIWLESPTCHRTRRKSHISEFLADSVEACPARQVDSERLWISNQPELFCIQCS